MASKPSNPLYHHLIRKKTLTMENKKSEDCSPLFLLRNNFHPIEMQDPVLM